MKRALIIILSVVTLSLSLISIPNSSKGNSISKEIKNQSQVNLSHTYIRVFVNGSWWIYEYNEDGKLVVVYPDEE